MSIIFVIVLYLLLWIVPQINDLIIVINQADDDWIAVFAFFASLSVLAFLISTVNSYFDPPIIEQKQTEQQSEKEQDSKTKTAKIFYLPKDKKELYIESKKQDLLESSETYQESQSDYMKRIFPKALGTILILIAAYAVNNTYWDVYQQDIPFSGGNLGFTLSIIILLMGLYQPLIQSITKFLSRYKWTRYIPIVVAALALFGILILGLFNQGGSQADAQRLFISLVLLAVFFLVVSVSYNPRVLKLKKYIGAPVIILFVIGIFSAYIVLAFNPQALKIITPLSIVMICIIGIYTLCNLIKLVGYKNQIPLLTIVVIVAMALAINTASKADFNHYDASTVKTTIQPSERLPLDTYIDQWIVDRKVDIQNSPKNQKFPIVLVSSEGGGSRAGLWTFLVQSYLYERNPDYFEKYLFSMTGASGGGVGNNMFYTQAFNLQNGTSNVRLKFTEPQKNLLKYRASTIYNKDYLSTSVASLMGRDLFKSITNLFTFPDRGALLEDEWEESFKYTFDYPGGSPIGEAYLQMMPKLGAYDYIRPIVITNTTHLQSGEYAVISPVSVAKDSLNMDVFLDLLAAYPSDSIMIKRSTAMSMNARFPYLSPAVRIKDVGQFGDAGYYDNVGGTVTRRLSDALLNALEKDSTLTGKYEIKHLLITNYVPPSKLTYSSQLTAPASIIGNATFAHPKEMEKSLTNVINIQSKRTEIDQDSVAFAFIEKFQDTNEIKPFIPLGRYLSQSAVHSLEARLEEVEVIQQLQDLIPAKNDNE
ncbi:hypothetical protein SAMN04515667_1766 [Formosa sp. Hel1_31_208]|nr:hypothetical protein SAMN04515667_1766 [Formosa sp. Hel1_31_208]